MALTLYSIDGRFDDPKLQPKTAEDFHEVPVLGKVEVTDPAARQELFTALIEGMTHSDGSMLHCFRPRHGIRTVEDGTTVDYVICFECLQIEIHREGARKSKATTREPQSVFNARLQEAGIPLAPGAMVESE